MTRLCIIANSHAGALKRAAESVCAHHPGLQPGFFAAQSNKTGGLVVENGRYVPDNTDLAEQIALTSGGLREIDPAQWDAFLIYGFGGRSKPGDNPRRLSLAFRRAVVLERLNRSLLPRHMAALRSVTDAPIFAALAPLEAQTGRERPRRLLRQGEEIPLVQAALCDAHNVTLVAQPKATLISGRATRPEFSRGSAALDTVPHDQGLTHDTDERRHMNTAYGVLWLQHFLPLLDCATFARPETRRAAGE